MRIIGGKYKGHVLRPNMKGWPTRPTTDISKEGLFNMLMNEIDFESVRMLDLFGGTGNHSFEFLSRGCQYVTYVDQYYKCAQFVQEKAISLGFDANIYIVRQNVAAFLKSHKEGYNYIFAGPPYPLKWLSRIPEMIFESNILSPSGLFVLEHNASHSFQQSTYYEKQRHYGQTHFTFFRQSAEL